MKMTLRHVRDTDFQQIATWINDSKACKRWAGPTVEFPFVHTDLGQIVDKAGAVGLALTSEEDQLYGFAQYWPRDALRTHLGRIIVNPAHRGLGIGKVLCQLLIDATLDATTTPIISLRVYRDNHAALHLYEQLGFEAREDDSNDEILAMEMWRQVSKTI